MRLKSGKELTQLALLKRLNLMGVNYNKNILGKNYYIDLYDKEIQSAENQFKIKNELEKDIAYQNFINRKLQPQKNTTLLFTKNDSNIKNNSNKIFLTDFTKEVFWTTTFYSFNSEKISKNVNSFLKFAKNNTSIYYNEINKIYKVKILPYIKEIMKFIFDLIENYHLMNHCEYLLYFVFVLVIITTFYRVKKCFKKNVK